ncbi:MAG TPA: DUF3825 domain-containing protein [Spirochaetota bacterium]|jgi:hypothetical protein|nr:DUF3825 domain-containing protein [Caldisericia bacterium]HNZ27175.1 DUF3825 domain-containing protein [Spirochaetota bacterium]HPY88433.1 DUF3825 domain-containing protein [Spirochaetota bacterium]
MINQSNKIGITNFGYIENIRTFIEDLNSLIKKGTATVDYKTFNFSFQNALENNELRYLDKFGNSIDEENSVYALYYTELIDNNDNEILAYFYRHNSGKNWNGIFFSNEKKFEKEIKHNLLFSIGKMIFDDWGEGFTFLEELSQKSIPEKWTYRNHESIIPHPILKSFLENTFEKILKDKTQKKFIISDDEKLGIFNSGLLDKFFHDIYIILKIREKDGEKVYYNPSILKSLSDLSKRKFMYKNEILNNLDKLPESVDFFSDIKEVTFNNSYSIDRSYDKFTHIIEERIEKFPDQYRKMNTIELARLLDNSINYAKAIAKRNYKLVVPQYRPQTDKLQLLMPIYLGGSFSKQPDFALVLDLEDGFYIPETILSLDSAYQNARLIAKPDDFWLNPDDI